MKDVFFTLDFDIIFPMKCSNVLWYLRLEKLSGLMYQFFFSVGDICVYLIKVLFFSYWCEWQSEVAAILAKLIFAE